MQRRMFNLSKQFWGGNIKFTVGKFLNLSHTDGRITANRLNFCRIGEANIAKIHDDVLGQPCLHTTTQEKKHHIEAQKKHTKKKCK